MGEKEIMQLFKQGVKKESLFNFKYDGIEKKDTKAFVERVLYENYMEELKIGSKIS